MRFQAGWSWAGGWRGRSSIAAAWVRTMMASMTRTAVAVTTTFIHRWRPRRRIHFPHRPPLLPLDPTIDRRSTVGGTTTRIMPRNSGRRSTASGTAPRWRPGAKGGTIVIIYRSTIIAELTTSTTSSCEWDRTSRREGEERSSSNDHPRRIRRNTLPLPPSDARGIIPGRRGMAGAAAGADFPRTLGTMHRIGN